MFVKKAFSYIYEPAQPSTSSHKVPISSTWEPGIKCVPWYPAFMVFEADGPKNYTFQIYIIASVLGRYRIVAVYHLQSLYPPEAVVMAWNLLQHIKKHPRPLEKELQCLKQGRYHKNDADYPCPFLGALLFQHVQDCFGPSDFIYPESVIDNDPWYQDNNSGYTVLDVTDPFSPAYCFMGWSSDYGFTPGCPIDPEGYTLRYFNHGTVPPFEDLDQDVQDAIRALQGEAFIGSRHILDEAWSDWSPMPNEMEEEAPSQDAKDFIKALQVVIEAGSTENAQQMADALPATFGVAEGLRKTLRQRRLPECCDPVIIKGFLIAQDLSNSDELDLSWMQLSPAQVSKVVRAVLRNNSVKISSLDISGNSDIAVETLSEIFKLREASGLEHLYLFGCPKVEDVRRANMAGRIGMEGRGEGFNSYFPADLSEFMTKPRPRV
ncbi:hypothetical protein FRC01_014304 [Tulasnella sp. 417]|nr:hypothetical protein FRC01_014304 [Tulasnella sp. 417]